MSECVVGVDIGATKVAAGLVDETGGLRGALTVPTPEMGGEAVLKAVFDLLHHLAARAQRHAIHIRGIGVGTAGQVDAEQGIVRSATANLREWSQVPLAERIGQATRLPVRVDNDGNAALLAEVWAGAAKGHGDAVGLTIGTGIGGGVVTGGRILHGAWGGAAELGHLCVNFRGPRCTCGSTGCVEAYASGHGLVERLQERLAAQPADVSPVAREYLSSHGLDGVTTAMVFQWAEAGDALARETLDDALAALAHAVVSLIHTFNPTVVVVGGGVVAANPAFVSQLAARVRGLGMSSLVQPVPIVPAQLGARAGVIGAASLIWWQCGG
ncbi:MAG: ROK family protein [Alicyclobacillus shizuokensis]|nr:ROK family protein [Alicyclobacillus shizuokensis]